MTGAVLELNDHTVNLYQDGDLISSSPGFVLSLAGQTQFGQSAAEQSRLHPVNTHNEFWHRLSMTPLTRPLAHYRHNADIAHAHLLHIAETSDFEGEVVLAVPGSFSREQLAILGGVVGKSPFRAAAMMDAGLFYAMSQLGGQQRLVFADLQLHQFSLTLLSADEHQLRRESVAVVQGAGWSNVANALVQVINDAFIQQSRFSPQHSAFWEQHLYNELPDYLQQIRSGQGDFLVSISTDKATHQARVSVAELVESLEPVCRRINQQLQLLLGDSPAPVLISERAAAIPGLENSLQVRQSPLSGEQMAQACVQANTALAKHGTDVPFISAWRHRDAATHAPDIPTAHEVATHMVLDHNAYPIMTAGSNETVIKPASASVLIRARNAAAGRTLYAGDTLNAGDGIELQLIRVHHGGA